MADRAGVTGGFCAQRSVTDCDSTMHAIDQKPLAQVLTSTCSSMQRELEAAELQQAEKTHWRGVSTRQIYDHFAVPPQS